MTVMALRRQGKEVVVSRPDPDISVPLFRSFIYSSYLPQRSGGQKRTQIRHCLFLWSWCHLSLLSLSPLLHSSQGPLGILCVSFKVISVGLREAVKGNERKATRLEERKDRAVAARSPSSVLSSQPVKRKSRKRKKLFTKIE
mmetsp:Transcript_48270/g.95279  ORF Transcript_48270/g.95279 Transcript_48270/m.95279 type:complete len:142 (-) Transcript_48270:631-1056(-)